MRERSLSCREIIIGACFGNHLGDVLCLTPLPRLLRQAYGTRVYISRTPLHVAVFRNNPHVAGFRDSPGIRQQGQVVGHGHLVHRLQQRFGAVFEGDPRPELYLSDAECQWAASQRARWPTDRPVCVLSMQAVTEWHRYHDVDWQALACSWSAAATIVQPVLTSQSAYENNVGQFHDDQRRNWTRAQEFPGAIVYRDLPLRHYFSLFSVADYFCGVVSGGAHVAAAFGLPSLVVAWRDILRGLRFPVSSSSFTPEIFLYPQHVFAAAEDLRRGYVDYALLRDCIGKVQSRVRASGARPDDGPLNDTVRLLSNTAPILVRTGHRIRIMPGTHVCRTAPAKESKPAD